MNLPASARAEYTHRMATASALEKSGDLTHAIADRLHDWQRIAWLLDPAGRAQGEALFITAGELAAMTAEAVHCRDIWLEKHRAAPGDPNTNARARALCHIARTLEIRLNSARRYARPMTMEMAA